MLTCVSGGTSIPSNVLTSFAEELTLPSRFPHPLLPPALAPPATRPRRQSRPSCARHRQQLWCYHRRCSSRERTGPPLAVLG